jgi:Flp pilus assembly protein TadG
MIPNKTDDGAAGRMGVRWLADRTGTAILEFALAAPILVVLLLNLFDFSVLIWTRMQTDNSAQMGAQAAFKICAGGTMPALTNCAGLSTAVTTAVQSTSLGIGATLASGYPGEIFYCTSGNTLQSVGTSPPSPYDCSGATPSNPAATPGDYIVVRVNYSYTPTFSGLSLASAQTLTATALQRMNR